MKILVGLFFFFFFFHVYSHSCPSTLEGLTGTVVNQTSPTFGLDILDANQGFIPAIPCTVVFCNSTDDVINAVKYAATYNITPAVRSGRHSYMAYSVLSSSLVIDVSQLSEITDLGQGTIKFGAGVRLIEAYDFASRLNLIFPGGTCPNVGLSGFVLGGGYGFWARKFGLAIDSLESVDIVLPNGELVTANETYYSDLFWACRGAGNGNFGVVVSLTLTLTQIPSSQLISKYVINWNGEQQSAIIDYWQEWLQTIPDELTANLVVYHASIDSNGVFLGNGPDLQYIIAPLLKIGVVVSYNISTMSYRDAILRITGCQNFTQCLEEGRQNPTPTTHGFRGKSSYVDTPLSSTGIQTLLAYMQGQSYHNNCSGCQMTAVMFDSYGGVINTVPSNLTAFPHRDMMFHMQTLIYWNSTSQFGQQANTWVQGFYNDMLQHVSPYAYFNYIDGDVTDWEDAYFSTNLPRLLDVKQTYDPSTLFRYPQSLP